MDKYIIAPPAGSSNNSVGAEDRPWKEGYFEKLVADDVVAKGPIVDVRAFGAKGDGVTDDAPAIQAALNSGYTIYIPSGVYAVKSNIIIPANKTLRGNGWTSRLKIYPWAQITTDKEIGSVHYIQLINLNIRAMINQTTEQIINPVELWNTVSLNISHCLFDTMSEDGSLGTDYPLREIIIDKTSDSVVSFVARVEHCQINGISLALKISDSYIIDNEIWNAKSHALELARAHDSFVMNNQLVGGAEKGAIYISNSVTGIKIIGNYFDGSYPAINTNYGIYADKQDNMSLIAAVISGNQFWKQKAGGIYLSAKVFALTNTITANTFWNCDMFDQSIPDIQILGTSSRGNIISSNSFGRDGTMSDGTQDVNTRQGTPPPIILYNSNNSADPSSNITDNTLYQGGYYSNAEYHGNVVANNPGYINKKLDGGLAHPYIRPTSSGSVTLDSTYATGSVSYRICGSTCTIICAIKTASTLSDKVISTSSIPPAIDNSYYFTLGTTGGKIILVRPTNTGELKVWGGEANETYYGTINYLIAE